MPKKSSTLIVPSSSDHNLAVAAAEMLLDDLRDRDFALFVQSITSIEFRRRLIHLFKCTSPACKRKAEALRKASCRQKAALGLIQAADHLFTKLALGLKQLAKDSPSVKNQVKELLLSIGPLS